MSAVFTDGNWIESKDQSDSGIRLVQTGNVGIGQFKNRSEKARFIDEATFMRLKCFEVLPGDLLISRLPDPVGRACIIPDTGQKMITAVDCSILRVRDAAIDPQFLVYYTQTQDYLRAVDARCSGTTRRRISRKNLGNVPVPTPSLDEQKRIVAVLDQAFAALDRAHAHAEANLADAEQLVAGVTEQLFPNDDAMTSGRSLADLCEAIIDCEHKTAPTQDQGIPSIRTPNIGRGVLLLSGVNRVSEETYREWTRRAEPQPGDLILAREAPAGNVAVIPEGMRVCLGQRTVLLRPKKDLFVPAYLAHLLLRSSSQARLLAHSRGATVQHINVKDIRAFKVSSLPSLDEQGAVVRGIERLIAQGQALVSVYAGKLADIANLRQSLLQKAFSGELT